MRYKMLGFNTVLLIAACLCAHTAFAQTENELRYDYTGLYLAHDIDRHFYDARMDFLENKFESSADEIRRAAWYMKLEQERTGGKEEEDLSASIRELKKLASNVENGNVDSEQTLAKDFAEAHRALAEHHYIKAKEAAKTKDVRGTAAALKASAIHLRLALGWAGNEGEEVVADALKAATIVSDKLIEAGDWTEEEVDKALQLLGKALEEYGKVTKSPKK